MVRCLSPMGHTSRPRSTWAVSGYWKPPISTRLCGWYVSPDGKQLAFVRGDYPAKGESALMIANVDGSGEQPLSTRKLPESFYPLFFTGPSQVVERFGAEWTEGRLRQDMLYSGRNFAIGVATGSSDGTIISLIAALVTRSTVRA